jgi:hypothetical protein
VSETLHVHYQRNNHATRIITADRCAMASVERASFGTESVTLNGVRYKSRAFDCATARTGPAIVAQDEPV